MIAARKRIPLSPEGMQALAALPQIGLGAAPQTIPGAPAPGGISESLVEMPQAAQDAPISLAAGDMTGLVPAAAQTKIGGGGILSKIGEALKAPGVSAALLRSAGATLDGGLGAGIAAGTSFMDKRRVEDEAIRQNALRYMLDTRKVANDERATTQTGRYQDGRLAVDLQGNKIREYGINVGAKTAMRGQDIGRANAIDGNNTSMRNTDVNAATSEANNANTVGASYAGIAQSNLNNLRTVGATMLGRKGDAGPKRTTTVKYKDLPLVANEGQYEGLAEGAPYLDATDGQIKTKTR